MKFSKFKYTLAAAACALLCAGCDFHTRQSTMDPKGPIAASQMDVFMVTVWVTGFIFLAVGGTLVWVVWHFREKASNRDNPLPDQSHGNPLVEIGLIGISVLLLVIIGVPTVREIIYMHDLPDDPQSKLGAWYTGDIADGEDNKVLTVIVRGYQWWWAFEYPQLGITTANELVIPVGKVVKLHLRAQDVIHSFWLPKIAGKVDLMPGRNNWMWIQGDEIGHYYGQCAEFCGTAHAYMLFRSDVVSTEDFELWALHQKAEAKKAQGSMALAGEKLFTQKTCVQCHKIRGNAVAQGIKGPDLTHLASRVTVGAGLLDNRVDYEGPIDPEIQNKNLFNWIKHNQDIKPGNLMYHDPSGGIKDVTFTDQEIHELVAYLQTLK
ncbi:MAG TPA: cytochrome c oxidase subunit II [Opitutales bacterium]|nr:cytochrome c oxidase subunit II [Opitutales bacterium]